MLSVSDLLEQTLRRARRERLWLEGPDTQRLDLHHEALTALLPHRPPFLLMDGVTAIDYPRRAIAGRRIIDPADPVFAGHFPGSPVYPGVLQIEMMAQLSTCFRTLEAGGNPDMAFATTCKAVFLRPVLPGDELELLGICVGIHDGIYLRGVGQVLKNGQICAAAIVEGSYVGD